MTMTMTLRLTFSVARPAMTLIRASPPLPRKLLKVGNPPRKPPLCRMEVKEPRL